MWLHRRCRCRLPPWPESVSVEWHVEKTGQGVVAVTCFVVVYSCVVALNQLAAGYIPGAVISAAVALLFAAAAFGLHVFRSRPSVFEAIELSVWCCLVLIMNLAVITSEDIIWRHRTMMMTVFGALYAPICLGMRFKTFLAYTIWSCILNVLTPWIVSQVWIESMPLRVYVVALATGFLGINLSAVLNRLLYDFYVAEADLVTEKRALQALTSMTCDATCWLQNDCDTITSCDNRFDDAMGQHMEGQKLTAHMELEQDKVLLLSRARAEIHTEEDGLAPVTLLPLTLRLNFDRSVRADLFVVSHRVLFDNDRSKGAPLECKRRFFIGVRWMQDWGCRDGAANQKCGDDVSDVPSIVSCAEVEQAQAEVQPPDSARVDMEERMVQSDAQSSVPRTSASGCVFRAIGKVEEGVDAALNMVQLAKQEHWYISPVELTLRHDIILGKGGFGVVVQGLFYGATVAVKLPYLGQALFKKIRPLANELRVLRHIRHPNLVQFHGAVIDVFRDRLGLVLELVSGSLLSDFCFPEGDPGIVHRCHALSGVASALWYLHSRTPAIVHGDLKPSNILIETRSQSVRAKLLDFGLSRLITLSAEPLGGTMRWIAPEVLSKGSLPSVRADSFAFGYILYFVSTGMRPFEHFTKEEIKAYYRNHRAARLAWPGRSVLEDPCKRLAKICLLSEALRPSSKVLYSTVRSWLQNDLRHVGGAAEDQKAPEDCEWAEALEVLKNSVVRESRHEHQQHAREAVQVLHL
eukprot:TRINITY_DN15043_c2_g1_i1.p1 TRINITY_DN15043_c2_g1~~TRINITY_DN15043_c2_g1_i1.p1  ORF type:complete len:749 (-),score=77.76 TRINITY_DN15043_c2_g1_i1:191-2437(-)